MVITAAFDDVMEVAVDSMAREWGSKLPLPIKAKPRKKKGKKA